MERSQAKRTSHSVYVVEGQGDSAFWTRVGAAWQHDDGNGFNLTLTAVPMSGRLVVRKPNSKKEAGQ